MKFWEFKNEGERAALYLYGEISTESWWGDEVTPKEFKEDLDACSGPLDVHINSGGGEVFAGQAIYNMLKRYDGDVTVYIDGLAASIASVIAMAGDRIVMPANALLMIHNAWTYGAGNRRRMTRTVSFAMVLACSNPVSVTFFFFVVLMLPWMADAGGFFVGASLGKHKLCPDISPHKTIEGAIGGIVVGIFEVECGNRGRSIDFDRNGTFVVAFFGSADRGIAWADSGNFTGLVNGGDGFIG